MVQRIQLQLNKCVEFPFKGLCGVIGKKQIVEPDRIISVIVYFEPIICIPVIVPERSGIARQEFINDQGVDSIYSCFKGKIPGAFQYATTQGDGIN